MSDQRQHVATIICQSRWKGHTYYVRHVEVWTACGEALSLVARFMGPTWGPSGADRTQVAPCWSHELCHLGLYAILPRTETRTHRCWESVFHQSFQVPWYCPSQWETTLDISCFVALIEFSSDLWQQMNNRSGWARACMNGIEPRQYLIWTNELALTRKSRNHVNTIWQRGKLIHKT